MDYLREGVHLRAMAQKDPLVEYRHEGHLMFEQLGGQIREEVVSLLFHAEVAQDDARALQEMQETGWDGDGDGGFAYQHESLAGSEAIAAAGAGGRDRRRSNRGRDAAAAGRLRVGQGRPERSVPVRLRQEVQEVPWGLTGPARRPDQLVT
jgi:preprotein translocase subunit SecA